MSMKDLPSFLRGNEKEALLDIYVQPKASRNELVGAHQGSLKIRLTAPPVEGEANKECVKFLAKVFGIPKSNVELVQGHKSRQKTLIFHGASPEALQAVLREKGVL